MRRIFPHKINLMMKIVRWKKFYRINLHRLDYHQQESELAVLQIIQDLPTECFSKYNRMKLGMAVR